MKMDLNSMKYAELRSIAKELGLKANTKADKLLKAIKQHYEKEKKNDEGDENAASDSGREDADDASQQEAPSTAGFVNTRRGRGKCIKRKITDAAEVLGCNSDLSKALLKPTTPSKFSPPLTRCSCGRMRSDDPFEPFKVTVVNLISKPDFKKLHEAQFNKMESIDSYVQRKTKQVETYKNPDLFGSVDRCVCVLQKNSARATMFSPVNKTPAEENLRHTLKASKIPSKKPAQKEDGQFRPSVLSARRVNVRFSEATLDNEFKRSLVKTPARMSPCVASSTPQKPTADAAKPAAAKSSALSAQKTPGPFIFTGNTSALGTPGTQKKPAFDLKASLSRPLSYQPHKGKLKPFGDVKENAAGNKSSPSVQLLLMTICPVLRKDRRTKQVESRKQKKENMLGARRGLVMT
uniref:Nucleolar and spindle associated protein 1 n=1 Tax=Xiphophorus couchianus TaxID=32473 RepID=A0A3B5LB93_9TELE